MAGIPIAKNGGLEKFQFFRNRLPMLLRLALVTVITKSYDFRRISYRIAEPLRNLPEHNLYFRGIIAPFCPVLSYPESTKGNPGLWNGATISYLHHPKAAGQTKYSWLKMLWFPFDVVTMAFTVATSLSNPFSGMSDEAIAQGNSPVTTGEIVCHCTWWGKCKASGAGNNCASGDNVNCQDWNGHCEFS